jgi:segregation and condensation protein B
MSESELSEVNESELVTEELSVGEASAEEDSTSEDAELELVRRKELLEQFDEAERQALVESLLFVSGEPLSKGKIAEVIGLSRPEVDDLIESVKMKLSLDESGVELFEVGGKLQLRTKPQFGLFVKQLRATRPKKLSQQAMETLAIVAYRQPIVRSDVEKIRGVDATPTLKTLIDRGFIKIVGHQETIGQPALYGTTQQFLEVFGLSSLAELPTLRDLQQLEVHADAEEELEVSDDDVSGEDDVMPVSLPENEEESLATSAQQ